jgi:hypothetical protein
LVAVPVLVLGVAGGFWLGETLGQSGQEQEDETEVHVAGECDYDPATGLPIPAPWCIPVAPCPTCTPSPFYNPTPDLGPFAPNPAAVLSSPPKHRVGQAKDVGRTDCPLEWQALVSETTSFSFCFPASATLWSSSTDPAGGSGRWDEQASVWLGDDVGVSVHRIGAYGGVPSHQEATEYSPSRINGVSAQRYETRLSDGMPLSPSRLLQEEFGYIALRSDGTWHLEATIQNELPGLEALGDEEIQLRRTWADDILKTVVLP